LYLRIYAMQICTVHKKIILHKMCLLFYVSAFVFAFVFVFGRGANVALRQKIMALMSLDPVQWMVSRLFSANW